MKRGDVVTVAAAGDYGKPRPAVIVQTDALPAAHASVVVCEMTSDCSDAVFRVTIDPAAKNGLKLQSQIMADKRGECTTRWCAISVRAELQNCRQRTIG